ncbi:MAG TPA: sensor domain-containing diguanylate cyclase [Anaerolineales bacterium]|nr:sensor domain-containing diguanylate cyclase [Anaerolineales bacterium]
MKTSELRKLLADVGVDFESRLVDCLFVTGANLIYIFDLAESRYIFVSGDTASTLGYAPQEILKMGNKIEAELVNPEDRQRVLEHHQNCQRAAEGDLLEVEFRAKHVYGGWHWLLIRDTPLVRNADGQVRYILGTAEDVSERKAAQEKLWFVSTHDQLTGLYNRAYFEAEVGRMEKSRHYPISVLFVDIDDLQALNDAQGHEAGDALLLRCSQILLESFRAEDVIARVGGDEFAVILPLTGEPSSEAILSRIRARITKHNQTNTKTLLGLSLGMATAEHGESLREAVKTAEKRLAESKRAHRNLK